MREKASILQVGLMDPIRFWEFEGADEYSTPLIEVLPNGTQLFGGYTVEELRRIRTRWANSCHHTMCEDAVMKGESMYFIISNDNGDVRIRQMSEDELLRVLNPNEHGHIEFEVANALANLTEVNPDYWPGRFLIVKGEIIVPRIKQVTTQVII